MGNVVGTDTKDTRNVELNIVPFIDLMSCLTAFLLVTAVWVSIAQVDAHAAGARRDTVDPDPDPDPKLSILLESDGIWVGVSRVDDFEHFPSTSAGPDWAALETSLRAHKASAYFEKHLDLELAAESSKEHPVSYQQLVVAMDVAIKSGFTDVGITDPMALSARPHI